MTRRRRGSGSPSWHKASQRWLAQVSTPAGRKSKYFPGKPPPAKPPTEAEAWIRQTITAVEQGRFSSAGKRTVAEQVAEYYKLTSGSGSWSAETIRAHVYTLRRIAPIGTIRLEQLTPQKVQQWINGMTAEGLSSATIEKSRNLLSQACKAAVSWGLLSHNPVDGSHGPPVRTQKPRHAWTVADARKFMASLDGGELDAFWLTLLHTGVRQGEARGLRWADLNLDDSMITVSASLHEWGRDLGPRKTRDSVMIPMAPTLDRALRDHRTAQLRARLAAGAAWRPGDWVFTTGEGKPWSGQTIRARLRKACKDAGVEPRIPHELRHTAVSLMHEAGIPLGVIGAIVGHSTVKQTISVYYHTSKEELRRAVDALGNRLSS